MTDAFVLLDVILKELERSECIDDPEVNVIRYTNFLRSSRDTLRMIIERSAYE